MQGIDEAELGFNNVARNMVAHPRLFPGASGPLGVVREDDGTKYIYLSGRRKRKK